MTAALAWRQPWTGRCTGCARDGVEVAPRPDSGERVLCETCAQRASARARQQRLASSPPSSETNLVPRPLSLVPDSAHEAPCAIRQRDAPCATDERESHDEPDVEALLRSHAEGGWTPIPVSLTLPDDALEIDVRVAEFFALVYGLRLSANEDRPVPFACRWVAGHLRVPYRTVHRTLAKLTREGVLLKCGALPGRGQRGTDTYLPGDRGRTGR